VSATVHDIPGLPH